MNDLREALAAVVQKWADPVSLLQADKILSSAQFIRDHGQALLAALDERDAMRAVLLQSPLKQVVNWPKDHDCSFVSIPIELWRSLYDWQRAIDWRTKPGAKTGCGAMLKRGQHWSFCGETDMGQSEPALCTQCGGDLVRATHVWDVVV